MSSAPKTRSATTTTATDAADSELRELLKALSAQGKAVLISSHILTELSEICDTCAIIEQGRLLATGPVSQILAGAAGNAPSTELQLRLFGTDPAAIQQDAAPISNLHRIARPSVVTTASPKGHARHR